MAVRLQSGQAARPVATPAEIARKVFHWLAWAAVAFWIIAAVSLISLARTAGGPYLDGRAADFGSGGVAVLDAIGSILVLGLAISYLVWRWPNRRPAASSDPSAG
jgi:hypothetical protein